MPYCQLKPRDQVRWTTIFHMFIRGPFVSRSLRPQTEMATAETATNRKGHKPERSQTATATNRNGHKPKRPQIEMTTSKIILFNTSAPRILLKVNSTTYVVDVSYCYAYAMTRIHSFWWGSPMVLTGIMTLRWLLSIDICLTNTQKKALLAGNKGSFPSFIQHLMSARGRLR